MPPSTPSTLVSSLNKQYQELHTRKENAFWEKMMGLSADKEALRVAFDAHESALQNFMQSPDNLQKATSALEAVAATDNSEVAVALRGWHAFFSAHCIASAEGRSLAKDIMEQEGKLGVAKSSMKLGYVDPRTKEFIEASSVKLGAMVRTETDAELRHAAWQGLRSIEPFVLNNGFIELVKARNKLGRLEGAEDFYDWKVKSVERMSKKEIFDLLDILEEKTRAHCLDSVKQLESKHGQLRASDVNFFVSGDTTREQDPYFPFSEAIDLWGKSFAAMGIDYDGATLDLDLVDRDGKYPNGFMHGPEVSWIDPDTKIRHPGRIHFSANAIPGMVGAGKRAMETLFHEGGHAAHFANIAQPSPVFGQEFAPTSVGFAETQSMFLDSVLSDADWQHRYAHMPHALIEAGLSSDQPFAAFRIRAMLAICYAEKAIYELPEDQLTPETILSTIRAVEQKLLFLSDGSPRPVLSVPHLLAGESSAYYHGYVLALMAVEQTRSFFLERDGHIVDNPQVGPALRHAYWRPGNSRGFSEMLNSLTGNPLSPEFLATAVTKSVEEVLAEGRRGIEKIDSVPKYEGSIGSLGAKRITVHHGADLVAEVNAGGDFAHFAASFSTWLKSKEAETAQ